MSHKGEPGAFGARNELELVDHVLGELSSGLETGGIILMPDGFNHRVAVDGYALRQALEALKHYRALLTEPLHELLAMASSSKNRQPNR